MVYSTTRNLPSSKFVNEIISDKRIRGTVSQSTHVLSTFYPEITEREREGGRKRERGKEGGREREGVRVYYHRFQTYPSSPQSAPHEFFTIQ